MYWTRRQATWTYASNNLVHMGRGILIRIYKTVRNSEWYRSVSEGPALGLGIELRCWIGTDLNAQCSDNLRAHNQIPTWTSARSLAHPATSEHGSARYLLRPKSAASVSWDDRINHREVDAANPMFVGKSQLVSVWATAWLLMRVIAVCGLGSIPAEQKYGSGGMVNR